MEIPIKRVIFRENPHIATINAVDFNPELHEEIDWRVDPKAARRFLRENGASAEALANVPVSDVDLVAEVLAGNGSPQVPSAPVVPPGPLDTTPGSISTVNSADALELIEAADTAAALDALEVAEKASQKHEGGRKGVLAAIDKRRDALKAKP